MKSGSERNPFEPIVASGKRAALPHGISSGKKIKAGDLVIIDFGAVVNGYAADCTRTVVVGKIKRRQKQLIGAVQGALDLAEVSAKPGMTGRQLDAVARDHLRSHQLADFFQHSLGHGLGLDVHELPRIGETSNDPIEAGNVITLEPGVYLPDFGGIRIENDYLITGNGVENLTPFPREVVCVE
jgi:Xaa-Pro aminopeptidase